MNTRLGCFLVLCGMISLNHSSFGGGIQASVSDSYKEVPDGMCDGLVADPKGSFSFSVTIPLPEIDLAAFDQASTVLEIDFTDPGQWFQESLPFTLGDDRSYKGGQSFTLVAETPGVGPPGNTFTAKFTTSASWTSTSLTISAENNVDYLSGATAYTMDGTTNISDTLIVSVTFGSFQTQILVPMTGHNTAVQTTDCGGNAITLNSGSVSGTTAIQPPIVSVTSPAQNSEVYSPGITLSGSAKTTSTGDSLDSIYYLVNGADNGTNLIADDLEAASSTNWTVDINLAQIPGGQLGSNTVTVIAYDSLGQSATASRTVVWVVGGALVIVTNGDGTVSPVADLSKSFVVGVTNTVTAVPAKNWFFYNWTLNGTVLSTNASLKFALTTSNTTTFQANFVTNIFLAAQGAYSGLFAPEGEPRQQTNSGAFTLNVTSAGSLSGDLYLGSATPIGLAGKFGSDGTAIVVSKRAGENTLTTTLVLDTTNQTINGTVSDGSFTAQLSGFQSVFSTKNKSPFAGTYTLVIPGGNNPDEGPYGNGYGAVTISPSGAISFAGSLADGTSVSQSSAISQDGAWPFYLPLYKGQGSLYSWNWFTNDVTNGTIIFTTNASWINATNSTTTAVYRPGFTNQAVTIFGSPYNPSAAPLLRLPDGAGQVVLEGGGLAATTNDIVLSSANKITVGANADKLSLTVSKNTGVFTGSFTNAASPHKTFIINGVVVQSLTNAQGYFLGTNQSGAFLLETP